VSEDLLTEPLPVLLQERPVVGPTLVGPKPTLRDRWVAWGRPR